MRTKEDVMPNEEQVQPVEEREIEQAAGAAPESSGPPEPVGKNDPAMGLLTALGIIAVALGGLMFPVFLDTGGSGGATRSARTELENRQQQVEQALLEKQSRESK
jgi:hypothetical protein